MVSASSFALFALAAVSQAMPASKRMLDQAHPRPCLSDAQATVVAANYGKLIANYTKTLADQTLSVNFTDYAESVNTLINECPQGSAAISLPLLAPTFSSREQFEIGQGQQPSINFFQKQIWNACDAVIIRWETTNTAPIANPKPVIGLIAMEVVENPKGDEFGYGPWLIDTVYSDFDSGAWLDNLKEAGICATPSSSAAAAPATSTKAASSTKAAAPTSSAPATSSAHPTSSAHWTTSAAGTPAYTGHP